MTTRGTTRRWGARVGAVVGIGTLLAACGGADGPEMVPSDLPPDATNVLFIHHSTGERIWDGGVSEWMDHYNEANDTQYNVVERAYPDAPYPWQNDPYDYWRLWVDGAGEQVERQATLEELAASYDVVVFKHCYTGSWVEPNEGAPDVSSDRRSIENYELQYAALKERLHAFPDTTFILWTLPPLVANETDPGQAERAEQFTSWVRDTWDTDGDNIHLWDFRAVAARDGLLPEEHATSPDDSHPNDTLAAQAAPLFGQRIVDVAEGRGDVADATGAAS